MFRNYIITAFRNFKRYKLYSIINVIGLSIALSAFLFITLYIQHELAYDKFIPDCENVYRLESLLVKDNEVSQKQAVSPFLAGPGIFESFDEVESYLRIYRNNRKLSIENEHGKFFSKKGILTDSTFFTFFPCEVICGDVNIAFSQTNNIIITKSFALQMFKTTEVCGKELKIDGIYSYKICAVVGELPSYSHISFNYLTSIQAFVNAQSNDHYLSLGLSLVYTYLRLKANTIEKNFSEKIFNFLQSKGLKYNKHLYIKPVDEIHMKSNAVHDFSEGNSAVNISILAIIAFFILFVACINYMNMATAHSSNRLMEIGVRKVIGASRRELTLQFILEAIIISAISIIIAITLVEFITPYVSRILGKRIDLDFINNLKLIFQIVVIVFFAGLLAGSHPALYFASIKPTAMMNNSAKRTGYNHALRNILVVVQFFVTVVLIVCTLIIFAQVNFMLNKEPGFEHKNLLVAKFSNFPSDSIENCILLKNILLKHPDIHKVSFSNSTPFFQGWSSMLTYCEDSAVTSKEYFTVMTVDSNFLDTYAFKIVSELNSLPAHVSRYGYINEAASNALQIKQLRHGNHFIQGDENVYIKGIIGDIHFSSIDKPILPLFIEITDSALNRLSFISLNINMENEKEVKSYFERHVRNHLSTNRFDYLYFNKDYLFFYDKEQKSGILVGFFAMLAIIIALLGLFGVVSFFAKRKTKEIGVRKVLGAGFRQIGYILIKEFGMLVLIANLIAFPVAWFIANTWLNGFAYHITISVWFFIFTLILTIVLTFATISYEAIKLNNINPSDALRYE